MENDLDRELASLEQSIIEIKTVQRTQNDSYKFYRYQTDNLYSSYPTGGTITIRFIPDSLPSKKVVCRFYGSYGFDVQWVSPIYVDPYDHLQGTYEMSDPSGWGGSEPDFMKFTYVGCYTNCSGRLEIS